MRHITHLTIENFRGFASFELPLPSPLAQIKEPRGNTTILEALLVLNEVDPRFYLLSSLAHEGHPGPPTDELWRYLFRFDGSDFATRAVISGSYTNGEERVVVLERTQTTFSATLNNEFRYTLAINMGRLVLSLPSLEGVERVETGYVDEHTCIPIPAELENFEECREALEDLFGTRNIERGSILGEDTLIVDGLPLSYWGASLTLAARCILAATGSEILLIDHSERLGDYIKKVVAYCDDLGVQVVHTTERRCRDE